MNVLNINKAIAIMTRAKEHKSVFMPWFQSPTDDGLESIAMTEVELHACGNRACFAGHVAVSPEFQNDGGQTSDHGEPMYKTHVGARAIADWLDISIDIAGMFVFSSAFYGKEWPTVEAQDVIDKLVMLRDKGEKAMLDYIKYID